MPGWAALRWIWAGWLAGCWPAGCQLIPDGLPGEGEVAGLYGLISWLE